MDEESVIIDSSALIALINEEKGAEFVKQLLPNAVMSSVNIAEVIGVMISQYSCTEDEIRNSINESIKAVIPFTFEQAKIAGKLEKIGKEQKLGFSLGDRACISLGIVLSATVYTADRIWQELKYKDAVIKLIR